ncbi:MAG TPA: N-6 DNA methylase [Kofleriaceae bacterium]|nr:N-6 DNA methylase [Kofleriaceae bacterium]
MLSQQELARLSRALGEERAEGADAGRSRDRRRAAGAYFTPAPLVEVVVGAALGARLRGDPPAWRADGTPELVVLDPAAGDGRFLAAAADLLAARAARRGHAGARGAIVRRCLIGIERDPEFAALARRRLGPGAVVHCAEALLSPASRDLSADVVIGNPPYVRSIRLGLSDDELRRALRGRYAATSHGEWDLYAAFIEQSLEWARPGGEVALVVPSRWLTARFAGLLRGKLAAARAVRGLVLFGAEQIFAGATTYASIAFLSRAPQSEVFVARRAAGGTWQRGEVPAGALGAAPWRLSVGARRRLVDRLAAGGPALGDVARVAKGAGTNADPVYVLEGDAGRGLEPALVRLCLRGRDVTAFGAATGGVRCLVPYRQDGSFIEPAELARRYPRAAAHLAAHRDLLERRERGRFRGDAFYRFGRPQNMSWLGDPAPKVVVPDVARGGRALLDRRGAMVLDSAYALRPIDGRVGLPLLLAVLNSGIVSLWLVETGVPLRGDYVRLKTAYLESLPLPPPSRWRRRAEELAAGPDAAARAGEIDDLVRRAYGVGEADWR